MKEKADMTFVGKTFCAFTLLAFSVTMVTMGSQARRSTRADIMSIQRNDSSPGKKQDTQSPQSSPYAYENIMKSQTAGSSISLACHDFSRVNPTSIIWKIRTQIKTLCSLAYRGDINRTYRINCSERMSWNYNPDTDNALQIQQVTLTDEGCYTCETVNPEGTFNRTYTLTVLIPPEVTLTCKSNGTAVCKAAAGKPVAQVSWDPNGDSKTKFENHTSGTQTVLSTYTISSTKVTNITCVVSHPAWNTSQSKECQFKESENPDSSLDMLLQYCIISASLLVILLILGFVFLCKFRGGRICYPKSCETAPTHNMQESNEQQELEPYASYVQKENVIYNTVYEVEMSENLPSGLRSET